MYWDDMGKKIKDLPMFRQYGYAMNNRNLYMIFEVFH